jgi:hypothetical protein
MKKPSSDLYDLVQALQAHEIRRFRQQLRLQDSQVLRMFEALLVAAAYDEPALRRDVLPELNANQFAVAKHYLYQAILLFLLQRDQQNPTTWRIRTRLQLVELLFHRELFDQCRHQLHSIVRAARQLDDPGLLQETLKWQMRLADREHHRLDAEEFKALGEEFLASAERQHALARQQWHTHNFFFHLRNRGLLRSNAAIQADFAALFAEAEAELPAQQASFAAWLTRTYTQATYAFMRGRTSEAYTGHAAIIAAMESNAGWIVTRADFYLDSIFRVCLLAMDEGRFTEAAGHIAKLVALNAQHEMPEGRMFFYQTQLERMLLMLNSDWLGIQAWVARFDADFARVHKRLSAAEAATYQFNNAAMLLAHGELPAAQHRLLALLQMPAVQENVEFDIISKLLLLIIAEQNRDAAIFQPWYRSLYRQLHAQEGFALEKVILKGLRRAHSAKTSAKKATVWLDLHDQLLASVQSDSRAIQYFDFVSWIKGKVQGRSFQSVFQERIRAFAADSTRQA